MAKNITIYPHPAVGYPRIEFDGATTGTIRLEVHDDGAVHFVGSQGTLFSIIDDLSDLLSSVNNISGLPVFEVYADNSINIGEFGNAGVAIASDQSLTFSNIPAASTDTDKFLVSDSGVMKYRTGAQVLSDIGASASGHTHTFASLTSKPTTVSGFGITDAYTKTEVDNHNWAWGDITSGVPTTIAGYGITDAYTKTEVDALTWDWSDLTSGVPTTIAGYGITDAYTQTTADSTFLNSAIEDAYTPNRFFFGTSGGWDDGNNSATNTVFTNVHFQAHQDFFIGAGNSDWFGTPTASHHDLILNTMQSDDTGGYTRGITFSASRQGYETTYKLGRWVAADASQALSKLWVYGHLDVEKTLQVDGIATFDQTIDGSINGNANTATTLATARTITVSLNTDVTGTANASFDGSGNIEIAIAATISGSGHLLTEHSDVSVTDTDGAMMVGTGTGWVSESGATLRNSLGLGTTDVPEFAKTLLSAAATWYMLQFGARGASSGEYGIGLTADIANRTMSFHIPNHAAYSSTGAVPQFGWYSNGSVELMTLESATGQLWTKEKLQVYKADATNITASDYADAYLVGQGPDGGNNSYLVSYAPGFPSWQQHIRYVGTDDTWRIGTFDQAWTDSINNARVFRVARQRADAGAEPNYIVAGIHGGTATGATREGVSILDIFFVTGGMGAWGQAGTVMGSVNGTGLHVNSISNYDAGTPLTLSTISNNNNIELSPNGTGVVKANADIWSTGNIGAGSATPAYAFTAYGEGADQGFVVYNGSGSTMRMYRLADVGYVTRGGDETKGIAIDSDGNITMPQRVGVGTAPHATIPFKVQASISGNYAGYVVNTHATEGDGLLIDAGNDSADNVIKARTHNGGITLLTLSGAGALSVLGSISGTALNGTSATIQDGDILFANSNETEQGIRFQDDQDTGGQYGSILFNSNTSDNKLTFRVQSATKALDITGSTNLVDFANTPTVGGTALTLTDDSRLSNARTPVSHNNTYHSETYLVAADLSGYLLKSGGAMTGALSSNAAFTSTYSGDGFALTSGNAGFKATSNVTTGYAGFRAEANGGAWGAIYAFGLTAVGTALGKNKADAVWIRSNAAAHMIIGTEDLAPMYLGTNDVLALTIDTSQIAAFVNTPTAGGQALVKTNDGRLSDARTPLSHAFSVHSGTLGVSQGGTGAGTHTSGNVLIGAGTGAITSLSRSGIDTRSTFPATAHNHAWSDLNSGVPTTLAGYGITDALSNSTSSEQIVSGSEVRVQSTNSTEKFTLSYNETDDTLDIVFVST